MLGWDEISSDFVTTGTHLIVRSLVFALAKQYYAELVDR